MPEDIEDLGNEIEEINEQVFFLGDEQRNGKSFSIEKENVSPYDIFRLAQRILLVCAIIFITLALIRIFYPLLLVRYPSLPEDGVSEVWEYSKTALNSIVSLVLGLYFGSSQRSK
jgi:hypothetical protein